MLGAAVVLESPAVLDDFKEQYNNAAIPSISQESPEYPGKQLQRPLTLSHVGLFTLAAMQRHVPEHLLPNVPSGHT